MRPIHAILALEDVVDSQRRPLYRKGLELTSRDQETVLEVYSHWVCLMLDLGYLHPTTLTRDAHRLLADMLANDVYDLISAFAELLDLVRDQKNKGFKGLCRRISRHLYHLVKVDFEKSAMGDVAAAKRLIQLFSYTLRLSLVDIDLTQQCLDSYMDSENYIDDHYPESLTYSLNQIIKGWVKNFCPENLHFSHGSGGIADVQQATLQQKYELLRTDAMLTYAFQNTSMVHHKKCGCYQVSDVTRLQSRVSRTIFVPKSYKTFRTISLEPATLQYLQHGVMSEVYRMVEDSDFLKKHIGFRDQSRNRRLALEGSRNRNFATIDLSAASDSVSLRLVKMLFKDTSLLRYLLATRSYETRLPGGRQIKLKKFAPMGSALCFPVETLIFAAICQLVTGWHGVPGRYSVYGDDMVVPTECVGDLNNVLSQLGFRVNREKSFFRTDSWFRESCGIECCSGVDVTPIRVSRRYASELRPEHTPRLIDLANSCYERGFLYLRSIVIRKLKKTNFKPVFGPDHLLGDNYSNYHLPVRWNGWLQRLEVKASAITTRHAKSDQSIGLRHWIESTSDRLSVSEAFVSNVGRVTVLVSDSWMPKPYYPLDQEIVEFWLSKKVTEKLPLGSPEWKGLVYFK